MNWYAILKSAMPLPAVTNTYPDPHEPRALEGWGGMLAVDEHLSQDDADQISQQHPDLRYLGHGANGIAYEHDNPESVIKLTTDATEAQAATNLLGKHIPCAVFVHNVQKAGNEVWKIEREKVSPLSREDIDYISYIRKMGKDVSPERIQKLMMPAEVKATLPARIKEYHGFLACLRENGIDTEDVKASNLGRRGNGQLILLDVGALTPKQ